MSKFKAKILGASALSLGLFAATSAMAVPTFSIDGITVPNGNAFLSTNIVENVVANPGDTLTGMGKVLEIDNSVLLPTWSSGQNNRELTFSFSYTVEKLSISGSSATAWFSGGSVKFYSQDTTLGSYTPFNPGLSPQSAALATATDGNLWLQLNGAGTGTVCGASDGCFDGIGTKIVLESTFNISGNDITAVTGGSGAGFLNAVGGLGKSFFDTNFQPSGQDLFLNSDFSKSPAFPGSTTFPLRGTADLAACINDPTGRVDATCPNNKVPEPNTLWLLGAGLLGLAGMSRIRARS